MHAGNTSSSDTVVDVNKPTTRAMITASAVTGLSPLAIGIGTLQKLYHFNNLLYHYYN